MAAGSGASTMLTLKAGPMRNHDYTTLFKTEHMLKDVRLCLEEALDANVPFPAAAQAADALAAAVAEVTALTTSQRSSRPSKASRTIACEPEKHAHLQEGLGFWGGFGRMRVVPSHGSRI